MVKYKFAKELLKMYDDVNEFEKLKERYLIIAKGKMPNDIPKVRIQEDEINICELLIKIGFAKSKSEAKRLLSKKSKVRCLVFFFQKCYILYE